MDDSRIRIQLVDDHTMVRAGLRAILEDSSSYTVVIESKDGRQAVRDYLYFQPDIVIMDIAMPALGGLESMRRILAKDPQARVIILSMLASDVTSRVMEAGAMGFLSKQSAAFELISAIDKVMRGDIYIDSSTVKMMARDRFVNKTNVIDKLSQREYEILMQIVNGNAIEGIAGNLHISPKTVRSHKSHIMAKLGVSNMVELIRLAIRQGLIQDS